MKRTIHRTLLLTLLLSSFAIVAAQPFTSEHASNAEVRALLERVAEHPNIRAVELLAESAARRAHAVRAPVELSTQFDLDWRRLSVDGTTLSEEQLRAPPFGLEPRSERLNVRLIARPFVYGDLADLYDQRLIEAERAALQARETRATLEVQALAAALAVWLAEGGAQLAEEGLLLAELAEASTRTRFEAGGASALEVGRAELTRRDAEAAMRDARRQVALAAARADHLAPGARLSGPFELTAILGTLPELLRAMLDTSLGTIGERNANRQLLPTLQATATRVFPDGDSLTLALESRTLQPAFIYNSGDPARRPTPGAPSSVLDSASISISWTLSLQAAGEGGAARLQGEAGLAALEASEGRAELTAMALESGLRSAETRLELAAMELELSTLERDAADARFAAGSIGELARLQAQLQLQQATLAYARARVDLVNALLDTYATYAIPPSEVLP